MFGFRHCFLKHRVRASLLVFSSESLIHVWLPSSSCKFRFQVSLPKFSPGLQPQRSLPNPSCTFPFRCFSSTLVFRASVPRAQRNNCLDALWGAKVDPGALRAPCGRLPRRPSCLWAEGRRAPPSPLACWPRGAPRPVRPELGPSGVKFCADPPRPLAEDHHVTFSSRFPPQKKWSAPILKSRLHLISAYLVVQRTMRYCQKLPKTRSFWQLLGIPHSALHYEACAYDV